ncbi:CU044_2847 family protein [Saccharopolyspora spinosa]|uniref:Trypsin-co-occurring domain-containing protein n=1 Tax=Saccharopolyspora spinosa TaxID=60894 RepID=A0A2N3Y6M4_SACSN|nr:CU044_2847 family protein [Saccharopolyspora spinosa]PKW18602.1 hypothetical protein A8926_6704 [Saccharopolyspora spinosa]
MSEVVQVRLPSGEVVWARVAVDDEAGPVDVGFADGGGIRDLEGLTETVSGVASTIRKGLRHVQPDDVTVQFGIEVSGKTGKIVSVLAEAGSKATLTVTLAWKGRRDEATDGNPTASDSAKP